MSETTGSSAVAERYAIDPLLLFLVAAAVALRLAMAWAFPNIDHPDEVFQTLEPAHRLWAGTGVVSWEWIAGIRSWVLPGILAGLMRLAALVSDDPAFVRFFVAGWLSLLSCSVVVVAWKAGERFGGRSAAAFAAFVAAIWPELVFYGPKALTEVVAAHLLVVAVWLASGADRLDGRTPFAAPSLSTRRLATVGFGLGLVFALRFHLAPALAVVAVWVGRTSLRRWTTLVVAGLVPVAAFGLVDYVALGLPFQSIWKNVVVNLVEGRARYYGAEPWHYYPLLVAHRDGIGFVVLFAGLVFGARRLPLFALTAAAVWVTHLLVAHKELRFVYPALPLIVVVSSVGWLDRIDRWRASRASTSPSRARAVAAVAAVAVAGLSSTSADWRVAWTRTDGILRLDAKLAARDDVCGIGLWGVDWWISGGVTHFRHAVPLWVYEQNNPDMKTRTPGPADWPAFDWLMTRDERRPDAAYARFACDGPICLWHRPGGCVETEGAHDARLDALIERTGL